MKKSKAFLCIVICIVLSSLSVISVLADEEETTIEAETISETTVTEIENSTEETTVPDTTTYDPNDLNSMENRQAELEAQYQQYQLILEKTKQDITEKEKYVEALVGKIQVLNNEIVLMHEKINNLSDEIFKKETEIQNANDEISDQMNALKKRIRNLYIQGNTTDLEIILGASDFSDFLDKMQLIKVLSDYDNKLIDKVKDKLIIISNEKEELEKNKEVYEEENNSLEKKQEELDKLLEENKDVLASLYKVSDDAQKTIEKGVLESEEIEKAIQVYTEEMAKLQAQIMAANPQYYDNFEISKSGFTWPLPGYYYLTSQWNENRGSYNHGAIDISGSGVMGANVVAASSGRVISLYGSCYHNWGKDGTCGCGGNYGNYVMIDHGNGKITIYAHLSALRVEMGQEVKTGQVIGYCGSTGQSTGAHLHFECRYNGVKYNPMLEY